MRLFVIGGLSYVGRSLIPELIARQHQVAFSCRDPDKATPWEEEQAQRYCLDLSQAQGWEAALKDVDVLFYLAHGMASSEHLMQREQAMASLLIEQAERAGVKRIIYLGSLTSSHPESKHIQSRLATGDIFRRSSIPVTEVRSGIAIGPGSAAFEVMRDMAGHLPVMTVPKWGKNSSPPIALENLIYYLCRLAEMPESENQRYDVAGPEWISYIQLLHYVANAIGRKPLILPIPILPVWLATFWVQLITSVPAPLAKQLMMGLKEQLEADPAPIRKLLPQRLLSPQEAIQSALQQETIIRRPQHWAHGVPAYRNFSPRHAYYAKSDACDIVIDAECEQVWHVLNQLGGGNGYFYGQSLWWVREWLDRLWGGEGNPPLRTDPNQLKEGGRVDSWEILTADAPHLLVMRFGMKAPGGGGMQFEITPISKQCWLKIGIHWHPAGVWGLLYWFGLKPFHHNLLLGMLKEIKQQAEQQKRD